MTLRGIHAVCAWPSCRLDLRVPDCREQRWSRLQGSYRFPRSIAIGKLRKCARNREKRQGAPGISRRKHVVWFVPDGNCVRFGAIKERRGDGTTLPAMRRHRAGYWPRAPVCRRTPARRRSPCGYSLATVAGAGADCACCVTSTPDSPGHGGVNAGRALFNSPLPNSLQVFARRHRRAELGLRSPGALVTAGRTRAHCSRRTREPFPDTCCPRRLVRHAHPRHSRANSCGAKDPGPSAAS